MHSPRAAHLSQLSCWSVQSPPAPTVLSNESTWIHFVADHFSPSITGHPAWRLRVSGIAFGWRLKNRSASPLRGFTVNCPGEEGKKNNYWTLFSPYRIIQKKNHKVTLCSVAHLRLLFFHTQRDLHPFQTIYDGEIPVTSIIKISKLATRRENKFRNGFPCQETPNYLVWNSYWRKYFIS